MSKVLKVEQGDYIVDVATGRTVITSDIVVNGIPYGTGPVVTNILYVTMDGSDTNDGSGQDPTRACRTITGATKSPLYQPGTSIKVAPGHFYENNPINVKPYTSIIGSDLRTSAIEPINKTQDLFHVNSSCYLAQMQFLNGRSGIVDPVLDRGAFSVSFPIHYASTFTGKTTNGSPIITDISTTANIILGMEIIGTPIPAGAIVSSIDGPTQITLSSNAKTTTLISATFTTGKILVYKSPYVQNCTNQSGPWLYDGTMFRPNQTVQLPKVVGTAIINPNQPNVTVSVTRGGVGSDIKVGMAVNTAQKDQGFFDARTLVISNISFIQEIVVEWINENLVTGSGIWNDTFKNVYDKEKCRRDIATIIEHVLYDTTFGGNSKSIQSGLAYWNGVVSVISGEQEQTKAALDKINSVVSDVMNRTILTTNSTPNKLYTIKDGSFIIGNRYTISELGTTVWSEVTGIARPLTNPYIVGETITAISGGSKNGTGTANPYQYTNDNLNADVSPAISTFGNNIDIIKDIITKGSASTYTSNVFESTGPEFGLDSAEILLQKNKVFMQKEISKFIHAKLYSYSVEASERDVGYIVDAMSQDILLGGNSRTIEAALAYYPTVAKSIERGATTLKYPNIHASVLSQVGIIVCSAAYDRLNVVMKKIVSNETVVPATDVTNPYTIDPADQYKAGDVLTNGNITTFAIDRNITILKDIVQYGPERASLYIKYTGTALFKTTGASADDVQLASRVIAVSGSGLSYTVTLDKPIIGVGTNAFTTLYFGNTSTYPLVDANIPEEWASRRCDPNGSIGGVLVDGNVVSDRSPIKSFVLDAFTQVNQGGRGVRVTNRGYIQLVSVFTLFSSVSVQADNGGIASITNSNANFGDYCMVAKGYGPREFSGTIFNPAKLSFNTISNSFEYNNYYPAGFFPNTQRVCVFVPDTQYRPHIALMMEVLPPTDYVNNKNKPGFLTSTVTFSTITKGALFISDIDVTGMYIGQTVYIYDQFGRYTDPTSAESIKPFYIPENTVITDIQPRTIYFSKSINVTAGNVTNPNYFTLFTCGNAYYTVLSSAVANNATRTATNPTITENGSVLPEKQRTGNTDTENPEIASLQFLKAILKKIIANETVSGTSSYENITITIAESVAKQNKVITPLANANLTTTRDKITALIDNTINIIKDGNATIPESLVFDNGILSSILLSPNTIQVLSSGTTQDYYGTAAKIINNNLDFCVEAVSAYITGKIAANANNTSSNWYQLTYNTVKCRRDIKLVCINIAYDLLSGGNYNSVYNGLSYYSRPGTYHIVQLEDNVSQYSLFPDGAIVNFYQRSYMSASGYLFEYVGAGTNYGALPQVGRVDPKSENEVNMLDGGKVFYTSTDQNGDFSIGPGLVISQATGTLSGRTFQKSLFAEMTPFILAIEG